MASIPPSDPFGVAALVIFLTVAYALLIVIGLGLDAAGQALDW